MEPILTLFGGKVNEETYTCAREYFLWITLGIPFHMFRQAMNPVIWSAGSPKSAMASTVLGAVVNIILDPLFIFPLQMGMKCAAKNSPISPAIRSDQARKKTPVKDQLPSPAALSVYFSSITLIYAGRMILSVQISSSIRCALQPTIRATANIAVYSSTGIPSIS